jgi:cytochrome c oxidase cbb3-type subunit 4
MNELSYEAVARWSQVTTLILFITLFAAVVMYAFWPKNRDKLERAQRTALDLDVNRQNSRGRG